MNSGADVGILVCDLCTYDILASGLIFITSGDCKRLVIY